MPDFLLEGLAGVLRAASPWGFWAATAGMGLGSVACCHFGFGALFRSRLIADTPTSRLRSAAQGYIELEGRVRTMPGEPIYAPLSGMPCVWYSYSVERLGRDFGSSEVWATLESGISEALFHLADDTGLCIVDPEGAEVTPSATLCWRGDSPRPLYTPKRTGFWSRFLSTGAYRYTEYRLHDHDPIYAIGQFSGLGDRESIGIREATRDLLAAWKRDRAGLLQRFDADRNGEIDMHEWESARRQAEKEVIATWRERHEHPELNLLRKPHNGRPYLLSWIGQDRLVKRYRRQALLGIVGFLGLGLLLVWVVSVRLAP